MLVTELSWEFSHSFPGYVVYCWLFYIVVTLLFCQKPEWTPSLIMLGGFYHCSLCLQFVTTVLLIFQWNEYFHVHKMMRTQVQFLSPHNNLYCNSMPPNTAPGYLFITSPMRLSSLGFLLLWRDNHDHKNSDKIKHSICVAHLQFITLVRYCHGRKQFSIYRPRLHFCFAYYII